ncbi:hypothetical protein T484DRAFT_1743609 [Baffinella frigidus]|nr:hypothetical protein T484DRAFT_1743609 [Cryptophyta sp. CCMP2293]
MGRYRLVKREFLLLVGFWCLVAPGGNSGAGFVYAAPSREIAAARPAPLGLGRAVRVVLCNPGLPPWVMLDSKTGNASGVDVDLARELLAMLDASYTLDALQIEEAERRIYGQEADMFLCSRVPTENGADMADYTAPYSMLSVALVQRAEDQELNTAQILQVMFTARSVVFLVLILLLALLLGAATHLIERFRGGYLSRLGGLVERLQPAESGDAMRRLQHTLLAKRPRRSLL